MPMKINALGFATLLSVAAFVSGSASAQNPGTRIPICPTCVIYGTDYTAASRYQSAAMQRLQRKLPLDAYGSVGEAPGSVESPSGRPFETDPDPTSGSK
jgi:hypothetical protein